jgi:hypothetical protein
MAAANPPTAAELAAMIQQLVALAQAQQAAAQAQAAVPPPPVAAANPPGVFLLWPGRANNQFLDYNLPEARKIYKQAVSPLETPYDLSSINLQVFLKKLKTHALTFNWEEALTVTVGANNYDMTEQYGQVTLQNCITHATTYAGQQTRVAQDSVMLYMFLFNSLTDEAKNIVSQTSSDYMINQIPAGICFLKVIIGKASVDTIATVHVLRDSISQLPNKLLELNSDIKGFNNHVLGIRNALIARGQGVDELLMHLFKAYLRASDDDFVAFMKFQRNAFETGTATTVDSLMSTALTNYELRVEEGTWSVPDKKDEKIIALQAQVELLVKKKTNSASRTGTNATVKNKDFAWKEVPPLKGDPVKKRVGEKTYHWCPNHLQWTIHTPEECRGVGKQSTKPEAMTVGVTSNSPSSAPSTITPTTAASSTSTMSPQAVAMYTIKEFDDDSSQDE